MMINWVARVNPSHPYLENDPAPSFDPHLLRISLWLWFSGCDRHLHVKYAGNLGNRA